MNLEHLLRAARARVHRQTGAFDLPSIMIGVAVVAILTVGVLAAIFGVIPWTQDNAAKQDLAAVHTAQGAAFAKDGGFKSLDRLESSGLLKASPERMDIRASDSQDEEHCYVAVNASQTGRKYVISDSSPAPRELQFDDRWCDGKLITDDKTDPEEQEFAIGIVNGAGFTEYSCGPYRLKISDEHLVQGVANYDLLLQGRSGEIQPVVDGWSIAVVLDTDEYKAIQLANSTGMSLENISGPAAIVLMDTGCQAQFGTSEGGMSDQGLGKPGVQTATYLNSGVLQMQWWVDGDGQRHRVGGPSNVQFSADGMVATSEHYYQHGKRHREDGPATIFRDDDGALHQEEWLLDGERHREDSPAYIVYDRVSGATASGVWYTHGVKTREDRYCADGIAIRSKLHFWPSGKVKIEETFDCANPGNRIRVYHNREDGSRESEQTVTYLDADGHQVRSVLERWFDLDGKTLHRDGGLPAYVHTSGDVLLDERYYTHGKLHRTEGSARTTRTTAGGVITSVSYLQDGEYVREGGKPVQIKYYDSGNLQSEAWGNGEPFNRTDGPSLIHYVNGSSGKPRALGWRYSKELPASTTREHWVSVGGDGGVWDHWHTWLAENK